MKNFLKGNFFEFDTQIPFHVRTVQAAIEKAMSAESTVLMLDDPELSAPILLDNSRSYESEVDTEFNVSWNPDKIKFDIQHWAKTLARELNTQVGGPFDYTTEQGEDWWVFMAATPDGQLYKLEEDEETGAFLFQEMPAVATS